MQCFQITINAYNRITKYEVSLLLRQPYQAMDMPISGCFD